MAEEKENAVVFGGTARTVLFFQAFRLAALTPTSQGEAHSAVCARSTKAMAIATISRLAMAEGACVARAHARGGSAEFLRITSACVPLETMLSAERATHVRRMYDACDTTFVTK